MSFGAFTRRLPKPLLFGIYGAIGGLVGALLLGELVWRLLEPPPPVPPKPVMAVTASPSVQVYRDRANTFTIQAKIAQPVGTVPKTPDPIQVRFDDLPDGVKIPPVTLLPRGNDGYEGQATVTANKNAVLGEIKLIAAAKSAVGAEKLTASVPFSIKVEPLPKPIVDIVFVLDVTGSMQNQINGVRDGIAAFAEDLGRQQMSARIGLLAFRDIDHDNPPFEPLDFRGEPFSEDAAAFKRKVGGLRAGGGGDGPDEWPESGLEAIEKSAAFPFRGKATKVILLITDAPPKVPNRVKLKDEKYSNVLAVLRKREIDQIHLVIPNDRRVRAEYERLWGAAKGRFFDLSTVAQDSEQFRILMPELSQVIADSVKAAKPLDQPKADAPPPPNTTQSLVSSRRYAEGTGGQLLAAIAIWTALIAAAICAALLAGQTHYIKSRLPGVMPLLAGVGGGLAAGVVGGFVGQGLYSFAPQIKVLEVGLQVFGWVILGGLAGVGLSFFVPNFKAQLGAAGGLAGGIIGVLAFLLASMVSDMIGRIAGATILGGCIGAMLAWVEAAFRRAWLEVRFGERETISVNLGPEPVKVGGDSKACTVWVRNAAPVALRYFVRNGQVVCHDLGTNGEQVTTAGNSRTLGNVTLTVRTGGTAATTTTSTTPQPPPPPSPPRPSSPPPPVSPPRPPLVVTAAVEPAPKSPPTVAKPPVPVTKPSAPAAAPTPPALTATARCTECGEAVEGRPGLRICKMCGAMS
jgi:hypothetical protein